MPTELERLTSHMASLLHDLKRFEDRAEDIRRQVNATWAQIDATRKAMRAARGPVPHSLTAQQLEAERARL